MATLEALRAQGWHLTSEGFSRLCENESLKDTKNIIRKALDIDLRDIGAPIIATEINKHVFGPVVLQILKLRNISASKAKPQSQTAPRMLKLSLTDGHGICQAVEIRQIPALNLDNTVPGTKLLIQSAQVMSNCLVLDLKCCKILGGNVSTLVERWEVSKLMPSHIRVTEDGPPAWVNFGKKIITNLNNQGFKSLENKNKENSKENTDFQSQRQDAISEAAQKGAIKKVFGGGVKITQTFSSNEFNSNYNFNNRASNKPIRKGREKNEIEKVEKPSQRVSLFDFLEDKLPASETVKNNVNNVKIYNNEYKNNFSDPVKDNFNKYKTQSKFNDRRENENIKMGTSSRFQNKYTNERKELETRQGIENRYQRSDRKDTENRLENRYQVECHNKYNNDRKEFETRLSTERYQNEKPPRFQKQRNEISAKFIPNSFELKPENSVKYTQNNPRENKTKPDTNNFVNKLANEINNISLYNSKYENEKFNKFCNNETSNNIWKWKSGDRCMAKYWEDNKFYNAVVTGVTNRTCMVEFLEYGNFEEVLHCDCIPVTSDKDEPQVNKQSSDNHQISGNIEFRQGKNQPFVKNPNKPCHGNRNNES